MAPSGWAVVVPDGRAKLAACLRLGCWCCLGDERSLENTGMDSLLLGAMGFPEISSWRKSQQVAVWNTCWDTILILGAPREGHRSGKLVQTKGALGWKLREEQQCALSMCHTGHGPWHLCQHCQVSLDAGARPPSLHGGFWPCGSAQEVEMSCLFLSVSLLILYLLHAKWIYIL